MMEGMNLTKIYGKHFCKCHNVAWYNYYTLINKEWKKNQGQPLEPLSNDNCHSHLPLRSPQIFKIAMFGI
jgi:hypothetical protein